jgi:ribosomal protein S18 acetylase RimI-like enzyme
MKCLEYAKSKGVKVMRLVTESNNMVAIAAVQKMGFQPVAEFLEMELEKPLFTAVEAETKANLFEMQI